MANQLLGSTSPYLLQHAHNPVAWHPWGPEAHLQARQQNKPIFLSIGYSACHWCHVMERESFENPDIAEILNTHFICIKVDREERPDLDDVYMLATQISTGSGGWPMSVWLNHDLKPFYAGTYYPPADAHGRPGFPRLLMSLADAWKNRRPDLDAQAEKIAEAVSHYANEAAASTAASLPIHELLTLTIEQHADRFDDQHGGFGTAPKFPPSQALHLWLTLIKEDSPLSPHHKSMARTMLTTTLDHMQAGGIYDHIGGAFARYSVDQVWLVPHFEKMLYDNAQLAPAYALAAVALDRPDYARTARHTLDFWLRDMTSHAGAFYSTLDADSEGHEGKFYVWTPAQIREVLPNADDANLIMRAYGITDQGNFEGANIFTTALPLPALAQEFSTAPVLLQRRLDDLLLTLRRARAKRIPPGLDDKVLTSWNGLMISAMAICGRLLKEPAYLEAAHRAIGFLLLNHMHSGRHLLRTSRDVSGLTCAHTPAFLEDHAFLLNGINDLIDSTVTTSLPGIMARKRALELADTLIRDFADPAHGGFFFTGPFHEALFTRLKNATDGATPSANGVAIRALLRLAQSSGREQYREVAMKAVAAFAPVIQKNPASFSTIIQALAEDAAFLSRRPFVDGVPSVIPDFPRDVLTPSASPSTIVSLLPVPPVQVSAGGIAEIPLVVTIQNGFHIQPETPADKENFATTARIRGDLPLVSQEWEYPQPRIGTNGEASYSGTITIKVRCTLKPDVVPGQYALRATLMAQPCTDHSCHPPEKLTLDILVNVA